MRKNNPQTTISKQEAAGGWGGGGGAGDKHAKNVAYDAFSQFTFSKLPKE